MSDDAWMSKAFEWALQASSQGEVPVGAVVVIDNQCIATGYNQSIQLKDPSAHAEIVALRRAGELIGNHRLLDATLYVTLEPCCMCAGCMVQARIKRLVYAAPDNKAGAAGSVFDLLKGFPLNHTVDVTSGVMQRECSQVLKSFFQVRRH